MAEVSEIIIDVEVNAGESAQKLAEVKKNIADLKKEQKQLQDFIRAGADVTGELSARYAENAATLKQLTAEEKMYTAQLNIATQGERKYGDSLVEMSAQLAQLKQEYRGLSKAQRESAAGKEMLNSIKDLDTALKEADQTIGELFRNVGNYSSALLGLNGKAVQVANLFQGGFRAALTAAGKSLASLGKALVTTPWGWVVTAIAAVTVAFKNMGDAIKRSDELSTEMSKNLASWEIYKTRWRQLWDDIAEYSIKTLTKIQWHADYAGARFHDLFSGNWNTGKYTKDFEEMGNKTTEVFQDMIEWQDILEDSERQYIEMHAERQETISELNVKVADREHYTIEERRKFLKDALEQERRDAKQREQIAKNRYEWLQQSMILEGDATDEMKTRVSRAYAEMVQARTDYNNAVATGTKKLSQFYKQEEAEAERQRQERQRQWQEAKQRREEAAKTELEELRKLEDMYIAAIEDTYEQQRQKANVSYDRQIEDIKHRLETEKNLTVKAREALTAQIVQLEKDKDKEIKRINTEEAEWRKKQDQDLAEWEESNFAQALAHVAELGKQMGEEAKAQYELSRSKYENSVQERLNAVYGSVTDAARIELEQAEQFYKSLADMDAVTRAAIFGEGKQAEEDYKNAILKAEGDILAAREKNAEAQQQQIADTVSAMHTMTGALDKVFEAAAENSEQYEKFRKAIAIADATISLGETIAKATAISTEGDPYTVALRVAAAVGSVIAAFAQVISTLQSVNIPSAGSYSAGGIVPGTSYNDELTANVSSGEMILNKAQQQRLFELISAGAPVRPVDYDRLAAAVAEGVKSMPSPVLDYREMVMFGEKVKMIERKVTR